MPPHSFTLDQSDPSFGDQVTFTVEDNRTAFPWVHVQALQDGVVVYEQFVGEFDSYNGPKYFTLGPTQLWTGGAASAIAQVVSFDHNGTPKVLQEMTFEVAA